ncbi:LuxR family transcriptional regulator [Serratia microhaemolytica]|uniref:LuxR family transcriptional regulator n=1 Tax=Serratia microhaemolytica TaxID=2675110 RepID=UPI000FDE48DC|nr:LuxR family transcriptional regulator [Serratia microhaemolytica]
MSSVFFNNQSINKSIKAHLEANLKKYSDLTYSYAVMNKSNRAEFVIISNKMEWFDFYIDNSYQFIDPVLITALSRITPFAWNKSTMVNAGLRLTKIFDSAKSHDITQGHTFVLHDTGNNLVVLSLIMSEQCDDSIKEQINSDRERLQMLLLETHEKLLKEYHELDENSFFHRISQKDFFSPRENEIIYWASIGKSYQEIAMILDIKVTTVKYHIGNVVKKLGVTNAKHAIRLGVELKLIRPHGKPRSVF